LGGYAQPYPLVARKARFEYGGSVRPGGQDVANLGYDDAGELVTVGDPLGNTVQLTYVNGTLSALSDPLSRPVGLGTDAVGRLTSLTNPVSQSLALQYNPRNLVNQLNDPLGQPIRFTFDLKDNLTGVTDVLSHTASYTYDSMDRVASRTDPLGRVETYQYDKNGNLTLFTDRRGIITKFGYDAVNRRISAQFGGDSSVSYTYDSVGRLVQAVDSITGPITRSYDGLDRLIAETTPQGTVTYSYDADGRRTSLSASGQLPISYSYDNANRIVQIAQGTSTIIFNYDANSRVTSLVLPNGVTMGFSYDPASQLTGISYTLGSSVLGNIAYSYNPAGQRISAGGSFGRTGLPAALASANYDADNQQKQFGPASLAYDADGNLTNDGVNSYSWNARSQLISISGPVSANFQYDAFGRRVSRAVGGTTTRFLYDGMNPIEELSGTAVSARLLTGLTVDAYLQRTDPSGTASYLTDALGGTVAIASAVGALQTQYMYDPFGSTVAIGSPSANSYQFTGRENDGTGLYFVRARQYSPLLGRFISEDPLEFAGGDVNLYAYVSNNPESFTDAYGLYGGADDVVFTVGGAAAGVLGQAVGDVLSGQRSSLSDYAAAAIGGAVGGEALLYTGPVGAGALGGAAGNLARQGFNHLKNKSCKWSWGSFAFESGLGAGLGLFGGVSAKGLTAGRGSYNAIYNQMVTKFERGTISNVSLQTAGKMFAGRAANTGLVPGAVVGGAIGAVRSAAGNGGSCSCN
jgi:RHS repeat-associated protein